MVEPQTKRQTDGQTERQTDSQRWREADILRLAITRTARRLRQEAGGGLTPTVAVSLASIGRHGVVTPGELARIEGVQRPTITRVIARLVDAGLVERREDPDDRRSALLTLSEEGRRYLDEHRSRKSAWLADLMDQMPDEDVRTLARAAEILTDALESHRTAEHRLGEDG